MEKIELADLLIERFPLGDSGRGSCMETFSIVDLDCIGNTESRIENTKKGNTTEGVLEFLYCDIMTLDC